MSTCPSCNGAKVHRALVKRGGGCSPKVMKCMTCDGVGTVPPERLELIEKGYEMRRRRIQRGESLHAAAESMGLTPRQLGDIEHGR